MRIHSIEAIPIEIPLGRNFGGSTYTVLKRCTVVTRMRTDEGLVSEVYNGDNREHGREIVRLIHDELAPRVRGRSLFEGERIWDELFALTHGTRDPKTLLEAIACVDCALWDLVGKAQGQNVCSLLGGHRSRLPIISIGGYYAEGKTHADIGREIEAYRRVGMAGCKFKVGGLTPEEDAKRVEAARDAGGRDFVLAVDANRGWSAEDAVRFAHLVEPLDIRWFEEPCHWYDDVALMARVRQATRIPITAGQSEVTRHGVRRLVEAGAVDLVNFDASEGGGVTEWRRAALLCRTAGVEMAHHEEPQIAQHLIAAVPHGTYVECFADPERDPIWQAMWANRPPIKDGMLEVTQDPGFGLILDEGMVQRYRVD
ncbi:MAG: mandelate racemase/muconate lactonizing enzyme family protein [Candidatus Rokuibacteriota bacterium]|nr:MAG: mandelate racemase/muconate lactonizing enzyme family protein [Candidatus Rokubacteria bacterium]